MTDGVGNGRFSQSADVTTTKPITPTTLPIGDSTIWQKYKENYKYIRMRLEYLETGGPKPEVFFQGLKPENEINQISIF